MSNFSTKNISVQATLFPANKISIQATYQGTNDSAFFPAEEKSIYAAFSSAF
jgi:hypothetical protein